MVILSFNKVKERYEIGDAPVRLNRKVRNVDSSAAQTRPNRPLGPKYKSYDSEPSFGNRGPLTLDFSPIWNASTTICLGR